MSASPGDWRATLWDPEMDTPNDSLDSSRLKELVALLRQTVRRAVEHRLVYGLIPFKGSQAAYEQATQNEAAHFDDHKITALSVPWYLIVTAEDHLASMRFSVGRASTVATAVLARAALEASARAWWHLDPGIDLSQRMARGIAERLYSNLELAGLEDLHEGERPYGGDEKANRVAEEARALNFEASFSRDRDRVKVTVNDERRPGGGWVINQMLEAVHPTMGPFMWRHTSAVAHGTMYALLANYEMGEHPTDPTLTGAMPKFDIGNLEWPITVGALAHAEAFKRMTFLYGWDVKAWDEWKNELVLKLIRERRGFRDAGTQSL